MTYNPGIPLSTDYVGASQQQILDNFNQLNTQFAIDHVAFNTGSGNGTGFHKKITFTAPISSPSVSSTQGIAYPKTVAVTTPASSNTELFFKNTGSDIQMTSSALDKTAGEGFIPGGLQVRSGYQTLSVQNTVYNFSKEFPTACVAVCLNNAITGNKDLSLNITAFTKTSFTAFAVGSSSLPVNFTYIAVGY